MHRVVSVDEMNAIRNRGCVMGGAQVDDMSAGHQTIMPPTNGRVIATSLSPVIGMDQQDVHGWSSKVDKV